jgi:dCTP deaminase
MEVRYVGVLTREEILKEIRQRTIEIEPFEEDQVGPGSIDLHLGKEFRVFKKLRNACVVEDSISTEDLTERLEAEESFTLMPGETVLGITQERIKLPGDICGWLEGRSRFARMGLVIHMTAGFVQPGINNRQVLEIGNLAPFPLVLKPGVRICQIILERTEGKASYQGRFKSQDRL